MHWLINSLKFPISILMLVVVLGQFFQHLSFGLFLLFFHYGEFAFEIGEAGAYSGYGFLADGEVFMVFY